MAPRPGPKSHGRHRSLSSTRAEYRANRRIPALSGSHRHHLPFARPLAVLPGPAPCCADIGGNDNAVVRIRASPMLGKVRDKRPDQAPHFLIGRRQVRWMPRRIAFSKIRGYRSVCCGRSTHRWWHSHQVRPGPTPLPVLRRKGKCPSRPIPCPSRMLQSHFVGPSWFSAPMRPLGDLDRCAMAFASLLPGGPETEDNRSATPPYCRPERAASTARA